MFEFITKFFRPKPITIDTSYKGPTWDSLGQDIDQWVADHEDSLKSDHDAEIDRLCTQYPDYRVAYNQWLRASKAKKKGSAAIRDQMQKIMQDIRHSEMLRDAGFR